MAPDATTEKIRDKNKSGFNSRQGGQVKPVHVSKEAPGGGKSRQKRKMGEKIDKRKTTQKHRTDCSLAIGTIGLTTAIFSS